MKLGIPRNSVVVGLLMLPSSYGDTVTTRDHLSVNGVLTQMSEGTITLAARYATGSKTLMIPMSQVESIEFNSTAFNPGAPSKAPGLGPGNSRTPRPAPRKEAIVNDAVELRGAKGERQQCKVISIDKDIVQCEASGAIDRGKQSQFARRIVVRILVGGGQ